MFLDPKMRIVVESENDWPDALANLKQSMGNTKSLGFDCEWVGLNNWKRYDRNRRNNAFNDPLEEIRLDNANREAVSLMQIATFDGLTVLVRLVFFSRNDIPESMKEFLADGSILKIGVNISEDCARLFQDWGLFVNGWLDLRNICMEIPNLNKDEVLKFGLKSLGARFCEDTTFYEQNMRFSNWCARYLNENQLDYAGQDAVIAIKVFANLGKEFLNLPTKDVGDETFWDSIRSHVGIYLNHKHDAERVQAQRTTGDFKRKNKKDEPENSDSDVDIDWNLMHYVCSNRDAVLFYPQPFLDENRQLKQNKTVAAGISPMLLNCLCDRKDGTVVAKVDTDNKRYIVKMTFKKINQDQK